MKQNKTQKHRSHSFQHRFQKRILGEMRGEHWGLPKRNLTQDSGFEVVSFPVPLAFLVNESLLSIPLVCGRES